MTALDDIETRMESERRLHPHITRFIGAALTFLMLQGGGMVYWAAGQSERLSLLETKIVEVSDTLERTTRQTNETLQQITEANTQALQEARAFHVAQRVRLWDRANDLQAQQNEMASEVRASNEKLNVILQFLIPKPTQETQKEAQ